MGQKHSNLKELNKPNVIGGHLYFLWDNINELDQKNWVAEFDQEIELNEMPE